MIVSRHLLVTLCALLVWAVSSAPAEAQLRIVTYNTATADPFGDIFTARPGLDTVLEAVGDEVTGGISKPIDVLLLQEQYSMQTSTQSIVDLLNDIYGAGTYARSSVNGQNTGPNGAGGAPGLVYNTQSVQLLGETQVGSVGGAPLQPRATLRYELRPIGYDSSSDFYVYNSHYKSDDGSTDKARRLAEAQAIRTNSDALGEGVHVIYGGDFNIQSSSETSYQHLLSSGNGQAFDPINSPGSWRDDISLKSLHTQSPASTADAISGLAGGGIDDRFDFQLVTWEFLDGEGLNYIDGSYHAFGNDGTHACSGGGSNRCVDSINTGTGASPEVLSALMTASDHLPVVADYQLPAMMSVQVASVPATVPVGATVNIDVFVENVANVVSALGADGLDYTLSVSGDLFGSASGTDFALGGANTHQITLDTSTLGPRSGMVTVSSSSQSAANAFFELPINFTVGEGGPVFGVIAKDDFDSTLNRTSFSQSPVAGAFSHPGDGFEVFQVGVSSTIPFALLDDSVAEFPADMQGIVDRETKTDAWFGVTDTVNSDNPSGTATATWEFDISGATELQISIDMGAMGTFDAADVFDWTYAIDGGAALPLFTSSVDEAASATYELASGTMVTLDNPLLMTTTDEQTIQLSNLFQTLTSPLTGSGETLTLQLIANTDGSTTGSNDEAYAFDDIIVAGLTGGTFLAADFNRDGTVNELDLDQWREDYGLNADSDADGDGDTDGEDFLVWQQLYGENSLIALRASSRAVPEPAAAVLLSVGFCSVVLLRRKQKYDVHAPSGKCQRRI